MEKIQISKHEGFDFPESWKVINTSYNLLTTGYCQSNHYALGDINLEKRTFGVYKPLNISRETIGSLPNTLHPEDYHFFEKNMFIFFKKTQHFVPKVFFKNFPEKDSNIHTRYIVFLGTTYIENDPIGYKFAPAVKISQGGKKVEFLDFWEGPRLDNWMNIEIYIPYIEPELSVEKLPWLLNSLFIIYKKFFS